MPSANTPPVDRPHAVVPAGTDEKALRDIADAAVSADQPVTAVEQLQALKDESRAHKAAARTARKTGARKSAARKTAAAKAAARKTKQRS